MDSADTGERRYGTGVHGAFWHVRCPLFIVVFGAGSARDCQLHGQRMETAKGRRQSQMTDNRTLILLSFFTKSFQYILNKLFLNTLFVIFYKFRDSILFLVIFVILIASGH
jgi:hypothetical protein